MDYKLRNTSEYKYGSTKSPISFFEALALLFIGLKLTNVIAWSWFWVLSPIIIPMIIVLVIFVFVGIFILINKL